MNLVATAGRYQNVEITHDGLMSYCLMLREKVTMTANHKQLSATICDPPVEVGREKKSTTQKNHNEVCTHVCYTRDVAIAAPLRSTA